MEKELKRNYRNVLDTWKTDLALQRIKSLGFPKHDWPDLMQDLSIVLMNFTYDPAKANGATEKTVVYEVITRTLYAKLRSLGRESKGRERYAETVRAQYNDEPPCCYLNAPVELDLRQIRQQLPSFDQQVLDRIVEHHTRSDIAHELGCDWKIVNKAVHRIRKAFCEAGYESN